MLDKMTGKPQSFFIRHLANNLIGIRFDHLNDHYTAVMIDTKMQITLDILHIVVQLVHRLCYFLFD